MKYAVGIPTRNREPMLGQTLKALLGQTLPPELIVIVDNNDVPRTGQDKVAGTEIVRVARRFRTPGPEQGHQSVLQIFAERGYEVGVRWDDDLVPEKDTLLDLVGRIGVDGCVGAGGMYPRPGDARKSSLKGVPDGNQRHLQFFAWDSTIPTKASATGSSPAIERKHLYSSFAYDVQAALRAGGFCVEYSRLGYRGETDFTLRLGREGKLLVDTAVVAWHHWADGGTRGVGDEERAARTAMDSDLFVRRMIEHNIDPEKW